MPLIWTNNRNNFLIKEIPNHHPKSKKYLDYWKQSKKRCIEGLWSIDDKDIKINLDSTDKEIQSIKSDKWRWMPPNLYFYVNFGIILHKPEDEAKSSGRKKIKPLLRDIEWEFFYNWMEARGFSGFEDDDEYSCNRDILEYLKDRTSVKLHKSCFNKQGELKKYIPARQYLRQYFNEPKGLPLYENDALNISIMGSRGTGKDLHEDTLVYKKEGPVKIKDINIGDKIYGADGKLTTVKDKKYFNNQLQYKVTLSDGRSIECGGGHLWTLIKNNGKTFTTELNNIKDNYLGYVRPNGKRDSKYFIPQPKPTEYSEKKLPIEPYYLGLWLGDGNKHNTGITTKDQEIVDYINLIAEKYDLKVVLNQNAAKTCPTYNLTTRINKIGNNKLKNKLRELNLLNNKHIPEIYKYCSTEQRLELVRGLMDSDGYCNETTIEWSNKNVRLTKDLYDVLLSLGIITSWNKKIIKEKEYQRITCKTHLELFKLPRKKRFWNYKENSSNYQRNYRKAKYSKVAIVKIEPTEIKPSICVGVDNKDHLFVAGDYIVTHNSYWVGVGILLPAILFDDAKVYNEDSRKNPFKVECLVGSGAASKSSELLQKVEEALLNLPGVWGKDTEDYEPSPLSKRMSGTLGPNNIKNKWRHEYEEKIGNDWLKKGSGSNIGHVVYTVDNAEAGAGGRFLISVVEEQGLTESMLTIHGSNSATMMEGIIKFGSALYLGTGGNVEKSQEAQIIFQDPEGFEMMGFDDEWEGGGKIGWFLPAYLALNQFKDENGNSLVAEAIAFKEKVRDKKRKSRSKSALDLEMMNYPLVPSEMFLNARNNRFPVAELKARLAEVKSKPHLYENIHYFGELVWDEGKLKWQPTNSQKLVRKFPIIDNSEEPGVIEIFEMPRKDGYGEVITNRYIQGTDTYDDDESNTNSLGSTFIFDLYTDRIVAEYTGRRLTKEFYEITRKLSIFYKAKHCYENNKKGLYAYYDQKNSTHLLADTPESLRDVMDYTISKIGNKIKGVNMSNPVIQYGLRLLEDWLLKPAYQENGTVDENLMNLHKIRSIGLLTELTMYKPDANFDRISAMLQVMILKEDLFKLTEKQKAQKTKSLSIDKHFLKFFSFKQKNRLLTKYDELSIDDIEKQNKDK